MANLFPSIFPYAPDSPEMKKLGIQTEFDVYTKLGTTYDETIDVLCEPKFIKRNYLGAMRDGEYTDFIILHPKKGILFSIKDNGVGIKNYDEKTHNSFGILSMKERAYSLGGELSITSKLNKGTNISLFIPTQLEHT